MKKKNFVFTTGKDHEESDNFLLKEDSMPEEFKPLAALIREKYDFEECLAVNWKFNNVVLLVENNNGDSKKDIWYFIDFEKNEDDSFIITNEIKDLNYDETLHLCIERIKKIKWPNGI